MTYTYAELAVSERTYNEIRQKLEAAGYHHALLSDGAIDMRGIGLVAQKVPKRQDLTAPPCRNGEWMEA